MSSSAIPDSSNSTTSPVDLRHMTSSSALAKDYRSANRISQHLRTSPARSPTSIPSSPTSVHSSSSAIFERDIEPISPPSPQHHHHHINPHRIPRSKATEQLEHSVPSVLDSAAAILAGIEDPEASDQIAVVAPATLDSVGRSSGFASPIGSFRSRSPSPIGSRTGLAGNNRNSLLLNIPSSVVPLSSHVLSSHVSTPIPPFISPQGHTQPTTGTNIIRPTIQTNTQAVAPSDSPPAIVTPTSAYFSTASSVSAESSPSTTTREHSQSLFPATNASPPPPPPVALSSPPPTTATSHPPSPTHTATKRLSFMSYSDLLTSTPASMFPLSSLTTSASSIEPPPHIPSVTGLAYANPQTQQNFGSAATSLRGFPMGGITHPGKRDSIAMLDDVGGEWEREGLGRGLEERLEALMPRASA